MIKRIIFIGIFIILIKFAYQYTEPIHIDRTYEGCVYSNNKELEQQARIRIKGELHRRILSDDIFEGYIEVDENKEKIKTPIFKSAFKGMLNNLKSSYYDVYSMPEIDPKTGIMIWQDTTFVVTRDFKLLWGNMHGINKKYSAKCYVAAPCKNKEDGNKIAQKILGH